ncbi:chromosome partition protein Smc-like [Pieris rapae]|uniref:chromosome partition protein Smc-like n=1 Tax=Pieris rapae TaxID=64459 RepID=UPI001E27F072|nr:chromosome partition protein Smc-like [Pieris rapae]
MIGYKSRVGRRVKSKLARNLETLYREGKCRECTVVVTRMDFAKILGKFTKVKIQYESSTPKATKSSKQNSNIKLKNNENGLVSLNKNPYNSAKELKNKSNKDRTIEVKRHTSNTSKSLNVLKENNNCKSSVLKKVNFNIQSTLSEHKEYGIIFVNPNVNGANDVKCKITLADLIPHINKSLLPNEDWCIEFFPKSLEPKDDKMYNRIAAELEDLMYNKINTTTDNKMDDFPSIMDILNDNTSETDQAKDQTQENKSNLNNDVEAILLGNGESNETIKEEKVVTNKFKEDIPMTPSTEVEESILKNNIEKPHSPSILDEALKEGKEQHIPSQPIYEDNNVANKPIEIAVKQDNSEDLVKDETKLHPIKYEEVTEVIFKKILDGKCDKSVTCLKNLRYNIQIEETSVEFIGAPKYITSIEDIQVLLEIVNNTTLNSVYVLHI